MLYLPFSLGQYHQLTTLVCRKLPLMSVLALDKVRGMNMLRPPKSLQSGGDNLFKKGVYFCSLILIFSGQNRPGAHGF